jgi:hypothetical protein
VGFVDHDQSLVELFESIEVTVQHSGDRGHFLGKQLKLQLGIALLNHSPQEACCVNAPFRPINRRAVTTEFPDVALGALVFGDQLLAKRYVSIAKYRGVVLRLGWRGRNHSTRAQQQKAQGKR